MVCNVQMYHVIEKQQKLMEQHTPRHVMHSKFNRQLLGQEAVIASIGKAGPVNGNAIEVLRITTHRELFGKA